MGGANVYRWRTKVRESGGAVVCEWCRRCARVVPRMRESGVVGAQRRRCVSVAGRLCASGVVGAQRRRRRCARVAGRLCASGVAGAREMVAAGQTKLMLFAFSHSLRI